MLLLFFICWVWFDVFVDSYVFLLCEVYFILVLVLLWEGIVSFMFCVCVFDAVMVYLLFGFFYFMFFFGNFVWGVFYAWIFRCFFMSSICLFVVVILFYLVVCLNCFATGRCCIYSYLNFFCAFWFYLLWYVVSYNVF